MFGFSSQIWRKLVFKRLGSPELDLLLNVYRKAIRPNRLPNPGKTTVE
jgi:hypothetical protein